MSTPAWGPPPQPQPQRQTQVTRRGANHGLHVFLSIITCGIWAVTGWPIAAAMGRKTKTTVYTAPQPPQPYPQQAPPPGWAQQPGPYPPQQGYPTPPPGHYPQQPGA